MSDLEKALGIAEEAQLSLCLAVLRLKQNHIVYDDFKKNADKRNTEISKLKDKIKSDKCPHGHRDWDKCPDCCH